MTSCCPSLQVSRNRSPKPSRPARSIARDCTTLVPVICSTGILSVFVCNSNGAKDDKWGLWIDGNLIGHYDVGNEYRATIILPASATGKVINGLTGRGCTIFDYYYTPILDTIRSRRRFSMQLEQIKGNGNYGAVQFLCSTVDATTITLAATPGGSFFYNDPTPYQVGTVVDYSLAISRT